MRVRFCIITPESDAFKAKALRPQIGDRPLASAGRPIRAKPSAFELDVSISLSVGVSDYQSARCFTLDTYTYELWMSRRNTMEPL